MRHADTCPQADEWEQFLLGLTAEPEASPFEEHLSTCPQCQGLVRSLPAKDSFVGALAASTYDVPTSQLVDLLTPQLKRIPRSATAGAASARTANDLTISFQEPATQASSGAAPAPFGYLGPYELRGLLGSGGMGMVYQAFDPQLQRPLAIKVVQTAQLAEPGAAARFVREARAAAAVEHDHIVAIFAVEMHAGIPCLLMPLLRGQTLAERLKAANGPLPLAEILRITRQTALGLSAAHERGLVHRDIKPANLWLEERTGRVKILDFGLAAIRDDAHSEQIEIAGTPGYLAPEQASGQPLDARTDLFSLGCVLYLMATGKPAFTGPTSLKALWTVLNDPPTALQALNPAAPAELAQLVARLLQKEPQHRPASAQEVVAALDAIAGQQHAAQSRRLLRRRLLTLCAACLATGLAVAAWSGLSTTPAAPPVAVKLSGEPADLQLILRRDGRDQMVDLTRQPVLNLTPGEYSVRLANNSAGREVYPAKLLVGPEPAQAFQLTLVGELARHSSHSQTVTAVAVHEQAGQITIYSAGLDRILSAWDGRQASEPKFRELPYAARCLALHPSGAELATAGGNKSPPTELIINRWRGDNLEELDFPLVDHTRLIKAAAYSPDGKQLATAAGDGVRLWNLASGVATPLPGAEEQPMLSLAFSADGGQLLGAGEGGLVQIWSVADRKLTKSFTVGERAFRAALFLPQGFAVAGDDGGIRIWSGAALEPRVLKGNPGELFALAASPDGRLLAAGGADKVIRVWSLTADQLLLELRGHTLPIQSLAMLRDGRSLASGSADGSVRWWRLPSAP